MIERGFYANLWRNGELLRIARQCNSGQELADRLGVTDLLQRLLTETGR